ncbi:MAG: glutaredoxin family protein [Chloroflexi bacterium]|nr:glutaredoxin family protein [Chloroflexota bacterium]
MFNLFRALARPRRRVVLYTREQCSICHEALGLLRRAVGRRDDVAVVDIESDPALIRQYGVTIPVVVIQGGETIEWPFTLADLKRTLARR